MSTLDRNKVWTGNLNDLALADRPRPKVGFYDTTLRDGEQSTGVMFDPEQKLEIATLVDQIGAGRIEAGFPRVSEDDREAIKLITAAGLKAEIWGFARAMPDDVAAVTDLGLRHAVIEAPVSDRKLKALGVSRDEVLNRIKNAVEFGVKSGVHVAFFGVDSTRGELAFLERVYKTAKDGYTDFAMSHARLLGFDLCPRLKELKQRHLFVPRGTKVPAEIAAVCEANVDVALIEKHWDSLVHLAASVMSGHASAVAALARFGSAAQGDPIYEAGVQLGRLLRTAFLADYFVKDAFRNELRRVLNRGEAVNALKRAIYTGRISPAQAKRVDEMQAVADALSLMANIVMAWNTSQMQAVLDRWSNRRQVIPPELIGKIAPTRLESINLRGVFRFPVDRYADQILPSRPNASITGTNG